MAAAAPLPQSAALESAKAAATQAKAENPTNKKGKQTTPPTGLLRPAFPERDRRIVIVLEKSSDSPPDIDKIKLLQAANTAIQAVRPDPDYIFARAYISKPSNNIVLETGPYVKGGAFVLRVRTQWTWHITPLGNYS